MSVKCELISTHFKMYKFSKEKIRHVCDMVHTIMYFLPNKQKFGVSFFVQNKVEVKTIYKRFLQKVGQIKGFYITKVDHSKK